MLNTSAATISPPPQTVISTTGGGGGGGSSVEKVSELAALLNKETAPFIDALVTLTKAHAQQVHRLHDEVAFYKRLCETKDQTIHGLERKVQEGMTRQQLLEKNIAERDVRVEELKRDTKQMAERHGRLRQSALQLDAFRKNIVSMLELNPHSSIMLEESFTIPKELSQTSYFVKPDSFNSIQSYVATHGTDAGVVSEGSGVARHSLDAIGKGKSLDALSLPPLLSMDAYSTNGGISFPPANGDAEVSTMNAPAPPSASAAGSPGKDPIFMKASSVYERIHQAISKEDFATFSRTITDYNRGKLSAQDTIIRFSDLLRGHKGLLEEMKGLVLMTNQ